ncbi:MAG: Macrophage migration inhibitory factor (MIF) [Firmicutes bacterium ADurb.Bin300]|jgi:phenylpyruvate tautomerase PptA (4-oxalocrotonate tautomerase family)|nr:MAG: Macrophage migration inhibitory factor (MIF) [Firmicutes bacterium ADurb.Bin300]HOD03118.1 phenylpyruvate tautomerase MIF-related protein [Clostridiales bacterium]
MPYIEVRTNIKVSQEKEINVKEKLGQAVTLIGKSESWLMVEITDLCRLWFKGKSDSPTAFVEVKLLGKASPSSYGKLTGEICDILSQELAVNPSSIYVKYEEIEHWGYNGGMF